MRVTHLGEKGMSWLTSFPAPNGLIPPSMHSSLMKLEVELPQELVETLRERGLETVSDLAPLPFEEVASLPGMTPEVLAVLASQLDGGLARSDANVSIDELDLSARVRNGLRRAGLDTLGDLRAVSRHRILTIPNLGVLAADEILEAVGRYAELWQGPDAASPLFLDTTSASAGPVALSVTCLADFGEILEERLSKREMHIVRTRQDSTLQSLADELDMTRERVRQIENKARRQIRALADSHLKGPVQEINRMLSEGQIISAHEVARALEQSEISDDEIWVSDCLLQSLNAKCARAFQAKFEGWWAFDNAGLEGYLRDLAEKVLPCSQETLQKWLQIAPFPATFPALDAFTADGSPALVHPVTGDLVRNTARHRDACFLILSDSTKPLSSKDLAEALEMKPHAIAESLRRDERFALQRPEGLWYLESRLPNGNYPHFNTTLEAALHVIREHGPLSYEDFEARVKRAYPVSDAAVRNVLAHRDIGETHDGRIDLVSRGARHEEDKRPRCPDSVHVDESNGCIAFPVEVTSELLRGSGLTVNRFVVWWLGLRVAPSEQIFDLDGRSIRIARGINGAIMSSLRGEAIRLGLGEGDHLEVQLDRNKGIAEVRQLLLE